MINGALATIGREQLEALVQDQVSEGRTLDYKRDLSFGDDEKRELARDVSSFANAAGGDLVFGVEEAKDAAGKNLGYPATLLGVALGDTNFETLRQRIENILGATIDPRVLGVGIHKVEGFERGPVVILRIPRSWSGPHMITPHKHFYSRNGVGKYPLDVREIGQLFLAGTEIEGRVRRYRDERLGRIIGGDTPIVLASRPKLVIHVVPVMHDPTFRFDIRALGRNGDKMLPVAVSRSWSWRFNLDGFVTYAGPDGGQQRSYSQAFRDGSFEAVTALFLREQETPPTLSALTIERYVVETSTTFLALLRGAGVGARAAVLIALVGVGGTSIRFGDPNFGEDQRETIDRDTLVLPDILLDNIGENIDLPATLRPAFDALWQASGWERSMGYDDQGNWDARRHQRA